ncbi:hypothetical protein [Halalkalibaculum sp. DA384]|uniref:hypothetical protein n=1 Tax=Halalkalibaculum sp. DA384 TaxID=3373606 RepID=UPI0037546F07
MFYPFKKLNNGLLASALLLGLLFTGCDILQVNNPNSLVEEDLANPVAASSIANGAEATLVEGLGQILAPYSTATDELTWIGTRDGWQQLDQGRVSEPVNEFTDASFLALSEARWTADEAIRRLEEFRSNGTLQDKTSLIRSYFYGAVVYITIADSYDNFVFSDREEAAPAKGEENMDQLYDTAVGYLNSGLELTGSNTGNWEARLLAVRARAKFSQSLWNKLNPDTDTGNPLVENSEASQDASAALALLGQNDWRYQLEVTPETAENDLAYQVNDRLELRIGNAYAVPTEDGTRVDSVSLRDPIDDIAAPALVSAVNEFVSANLYANYTLISERELRLIIAEDALAGNDTNTFEDQINEIRSLDQLSEYTGQIPPVELLEHSRRVNLFLQGRRLADHYRFGSDSPEWGANRDEPGTFFPITITEIRANPNISF